MTDTDSIIDREQEDQRMFRSFFFAGFEGATGYNMHGEWVDQIAATHHDKTRGWRLSPSA